MNKTIAVPVKEYHRLRRIENTYNVMRHTFAFADTHTLETPAILDQATILKGLKSTGKYSPKFLRSIATGLKESRTFGG
jgi:hypothetical protein